MYYSKYDFYQVRLDDIELTIFSCLLNKPKLMEKTKLEDKHFAKHKEIWIFMKSFYRRFKCFDLNLMYTISSNKQNLIGFITQLLDIEPVPANFELYEQQLIDQYEQKQQERIKINTIYNLANDLINGNIKLEKFYEKIDALKITS